MSGHALGGHLAVDSSAALVRNYRYIEERMMRIMGGWIALTPELPAKLLLGRHVWDCAQHADAWGRRLPELRARAQQSEPATAAVAGVMDLLAGRERPDETLERLAAVYRVLKPHLVDVYEDHLRRSNPVYEPPTRRILERCLDEERRHAAAGQTVLEALLQRAEGRQRVEAWEDRLRAALTSAGGVTGDATVVSRPRVEHPRAGDDVVAIGSAFIVPDLPAELATAIEAHRRALAAADVAAAAGQAVDAIQDQIRALYQALRGPLMGFEIVGVARLGAYRVIKLALKGPDGLAVIQQQWRPGHGGWQLHGAEVVRVAPPR